MPVGTILLLVSGVEGVHFFCFAGGLKKPLRQLPVKGLDKNCFAIIFLKVMFKGGTCIAWRSHFGETTL